MDARTISDESGLGIEVLVSVPDDEVLRVITVRDSTEGPVVLTTLERDLQGQPIEITSPSLAPAQAEAVVAAANRLRTAVGRDGARSSASWETANRLLYEVERYLEQIEPPAGSDPPFDEALVRILLRGPEAWNRWYDDNPSVRLNLAGVYLPGANLSGTMLWIADLRGADLTQADFTGARLGGANLSNANLWGTNFTRADMEGAVLDEASLSSAKLTDAVLHMASMRTADLEWAQLHGAMLDSADLTGASLTRADLTGATLRGTILTGVELDHAVLNDTDLRGAVGARFNDNDIRGTRFTVRPSRLNWTSREQFVRNAGQVLRTPFAMASTDDPWSLLRRSYTGANLVLVWLLLLLFVIPRMLTVVGLYLLREYQDAALVFLQASVADAQVGSDTTVQSALAELRSRRGHDVWRVALGIHRGGIGNYTWGLLIVVLFLYNTVRFALTIQVTALRDAESRSGVTPSRSDYERLYSVHRGLRWIAIVATVVAIYNLGRFLDWFFTETVHLMVRWPDSSLALHSALLSLRAA